MSQNPYGGAGAYGEYAYGNQTRQGQESGCTCEDKEDLGAGVQGEWYGQVYQCEACRTIYFYAIRKADQDDV